MAYRPPRVSNSGVYGKALVKLGKKGDKKAVLIKFDEGDSFVLNPSKCPKYVQSGQFVVSLTPEKDGIRGMRPINGQFKGRVSKFLSQEGKPPIPRTKDVTFKGESYSYQYFTVLIEITSPSKYKGMEVVFMPRYHFGEALETVNGEPRRVTAITKLRSKYTAMLDEFLTATGAWDKGPIPYSDNILPTLQKRIQVSNKEFGFVLKDGWIQYIIIPDANELESNDDWNDESSDEDDQKDEQLEFNFNASDSDDDDEDFGWGSPDVEDSDENDEEDDEPWNDVE